MFNSIYKKYHQSSCSTRAFAVARTQSTLPVLLILLLSGCSSAYVDNVSSEKNFRSSTSDVTTRKKDFLIDFDSYVLRTMNDRHVPGLAVGIVKDGRVWLAKGYGTLESHGKRPVTSHTIFSIGSLTKGFTSVLAGVMARDGKIAFDKPIYEVAPDFAKTVPTQFRGATFRHLLAHKSGLPSLHNLFLYGNDLSAQEIFVGLSALKPVSPCGREFHYSNEGYTALGQALVEVNNRENAKNKNEEKSFESLLTAKVLNPLGLKHTSFFKPMPSEPGDVAAPNVLNRDRTASVATAPVNLKNQIAAAGLYSNVDDLCEWLKFQLPDGPSEDSQLLSTDEIEELQKAMVSTNEPTAKDGSNDDAKKQFISAALGWFVTSTHNCKMIFNQGDLLGMKCLATLIPEKKLGIVIVSNLSENSEVLVVQHKILDFFAGPEEIQGDWIKKLQDADAKDYRKHDEAFAPPNKVIIPAAQLTAKMVGHYHSDALGNIEIFAKNDSLLLKYGHRLVSNMVLFDGGSLDAQKLKVFFDYPTVWPAPIELKQMPGGDRRHFDELTVDGIGSFKRI